MGSPRDSGGRAGRTPPTRRRRSQQRVGERRRPGERRAVRDEERALRAVVAARDRRRVEEHDRERAERDDGQHGEHDPSVARGKPARGVRQDEQGERNERERAQRVSEREEHGVIGCLERAERPDEADGEHLRARSVVRSVGCGDRAGDGEHHARRGDEHDERPPLGQVVGEHEPEGDGVQNRSKPDRGGQPAARHGSSRRTAEPLSSAFEMKPRAPLVEISPL